MPAGGQAPMAEWSWHLPEQLADPVVHALHLYWSPPAGQHRGLGIFRLRAGEGRELPVDLADVAALAASYRDIGNTDEADRIAAQVDSLSATAAEHFQQHRIPR
jgi:hypothetical protein